MRPSAEEGLQVEPGTELTPERPHARRWASALLEAVLERLRIEMVAAGKGRLFEALGGFLSDAAAPYLYSDAAGRLGLAEAATRKSLQRMRQRYQELLREEVATRWARWHEVEDELKYLLHVFDR